MNEDKTVDVVNDLPAVSPTNVTMTYAPYALMLLFGILLLALAIRRSMAENEK